MKKIYNAPVAQEIALRPWQPLMIVSGLGDPTPDGDGIGYDGPGGSFGSGEEVAAPLQLILDDF